MKSTITRINANDPIVISPWFKQLMESLQPEEEVEISKEDWAKLTPKMKQRIKNGQITLVMPA